MRMRFRSRTAVGVFTAMTAVATVTVAGPAGGATLVKPYAVGVSGAGYETVPLLSVGDTVPESGNTGRSYQMVGIPDGLGAYQEGGVGALFMNHELTASTLSEPIVGGPLNRGAFVSRYELGRRGVVSGERAYDTVHAENGPPMPAPEVGNTTPAFGRFCSGSMAGPEVGFDRQIYLTNEEADAGGTFDPRGGSTVAIFDNEAHTLPKLGHFAKENTVVAPGTGARTVMFSLEDGPSAPDSQLYMYVGHKDPSAASVLTRNGLDNGRLYVFVSTNSTHTTEETFTAGSTNGRWVEIPNAENLTQAQLEAASDAVGALGFVRIEDGAFNKTVANEFFFVTTGDASSTHNKLGRLYRVSLNATNPIDQATLEVIYSADQVITAGGDTALSPDNIDTSSRYLMIQEDGTSASRPVMASKGRDGSIWRFDLLSNFAASRVVQLNPPGRDNIPVGPGVWESSGIIDASTLGDPDGWIFDVQAHPPTTAPVPNVVEDGQLLIMRPVRYAGRTPFPLLNPDCGGRVATIVGTEGVDKLFGTAGPDVIVGLGGNDSLYGLGGDDVICGDTGDDVIDGGAGEDTLDGGAGKDRVIGGLGNDDVRGGDDADSLFGNAGNDALNGGPAPDNCNGGTGTNTFVACEVLPAGTG